jgi:hypothetical protein
MLSVIEKNTTRMYFFGSARSLSTLAAPATCD